MRGNMRLLHFSQRICCHPPIGRPVGGWPLPVLQGDCLGPFRMFAGGIVFAAFNAVSNNSSHGIYACQSALGILERLKKQSSVLRVRIGLHTCQVLAGNIRTGNAATFNILGSGVRMCFIMARLNAQLKTSVLLSSTTYDKARDHFVTRGVDVVKVAETGMSVAAAARPRRIPHDTDVDSE